MKLDRAIEIMIDSQDMAKPYLLPGYEDACKLLIEAGKRERECRKGLPPEHWDLLPGETEE